MNTNDKKFETLKAENEIKRERLHQLQIENDNKKKVGQDSEDEAAKHE